MKKVMTYGLMIVGLSAGLALGGCATATEKEVEAKVAAEKPATHTGELAAKGFDTWAMSTALTADQKSRLATIHSSTAREAFRIRGEITKTKSALFKELARGNYEAKTIDTLKTKIVKLDQERLDVMFKALDSVEKTIGRGEDAQKYYRFLEVMEAQPVREF